MVSPHPKMRGTLPLLRSVWRGPFVTPFPDLQAALSGGAVRTDQRSCVILPTFVGATFQVHNGKDYVQVQVTEDMVGHKLGEFAPSKKWVKFKDSQKKKK
ncbi:mitochondrial ribosomal small subunit component [Blastocladiella emersonii ATCC 22665]|nr:mitochondrial ribosomal small subunit component [Blastocladiella emersonii ATCC 22665]